MLTTRLIKVNPLRDCHSLKSKPYEEKCFYNLQVSYVKSRFYFTLFILEVKPHDEVSDTEDS